MWIDKYDWDEPFSDDLKNKIDKWIKNLNELENIEIERCLKTKEGNIFIFTDASELGYAAIAYYVSKLTPHAKLIACKTKVAPLTSLSVPRLELLAAELGIKLAKKLEKSLKIEIMKMTFWTDSLDVLGWISNRSRYFGPFVANRVGFIQESVNISQWKYIESKNNPADIPSRGQTMSEFLKNKFWFSRINNFEEQIQSN